MSLDYETETRSFLVLSNQTAARAMREVDEFLKTLDEKKSYSVAYYSEHYPMPEEFEGEHQSGDRIIVEYFDYKSCGENWDVIATQGGYYDEDNTVVTILKERKRYYDNCMNKLLYSSDWDFRTYEEPEGYADLETWVGGKYRADVIEMFEKARKNGEFESEDAKWDEIDFQGAKQWFNELDGQSRAIFMRYLVDNSFFEAKDNLDSGEFTLFESTYNRSSDAYKINGAFKAIGEELANYYDIFVDVPEHCEDLINYFDYDAYGYSQVRYGDYEFLGYYERDESDGTLFWKQGTIEFH